MYEQQHAAKLDARTIEYRDEYWVTTHGNMWVDENKGVSRESYYDLLPHPGWRYEHTVWSSGRLVVTPRPPLP